MQNFFDDYLNNVPGALQFFAGEGSLPERLALAASSPVPARSPELIQYLKETNTADWQRESLQKLADGARVIVTGQQLGFLGGPVFTLYKILTAVALAKQIESSHGIKVVPIFWLQSEDHDFEEIRKANLQAEGESLVELALNARPNGASVGGIKLEAGELNDSHKFIESFKDADSGWQALLKSAFQPGATIAESFLGVMREALRGTGVLFFDPLAPKVKQMASALIRRSFEEVKVIDSTLLEVTAKLEALGYRGQVALKPGYPLWFYSDGVSRERLQLKKGELHGKERSYPLAEMLAEISASPGRFTSSALIRTVFQEHLFNSIAYVSGPAELTYWAQTLPLFNLFGIAQPVVVPRARVRVLEPRYLSLLKKIGATVDQVDLGLDAFLRSKYSGTEFDSSQAFAFLDTEFAERSKSLSKLFGEVDKNLIKLNEKTFNSARASYMRLKARYERALVERESIVSKQFYRVREALYPNGLPQERQVSLASFLLKYGSDFVATALKAISASDYGKLSTLHLGAGESDAI